MFLEKFERGGQEEGGKRDLLGTFSAERGVKIQDNGVNPSPLHAHPVFSARKTWSSREQTLNYSHSACPRSRLFGNGLS